MRKFDSLFGHITEEQKAEAKKEYEAKQERKQKSFYHCSIPDWNGQGGMIEFWINEDNSFESEDSRIQDKEIREGIEKLLYW